MIMYGQIPHILGIILKIYSASLDLKIGSMGRDQEITLLVQLQHSAIPLGLKLEHE